MSCWVFFPFSFCSLLCAKVRPGRRLVPEAEATLIPGATPAPLPHVPIKSRHTHTNLNLSFLPPKTPTPGVQPGQGTGEPSSRRGTNPPHLQPQHSRSSRPARARSCASACPGAVWVASGPTVTGQPVPKNELKKRKEKKRWQRAGGNQPCRASLQPGDTEAGRKIKEQCEE